MRKSRFISILAAMVLAGSVSAQPVQGDLVLTSQGSAAGVYFLSGTSMVLRTLLPNFVTSGVKTTHNNGSVHVIGGNTGNIYKLDARGSLYTITTSTPQGGAAMELDQDGSYMVVNSFNRILYRLQGNSPFVYLTLTSSHGSPNAICRDGNTGDWIIGTTMNGRLYRVNRETREITTLYSGSAMSSIFGVAFMPQTGEFAVVRSRMGYTTLFEELAIIRSSGSVHYTRQIENANAVTVNHKTGRIYVAAKNKVVELSSSATVLASRTCYPSSLEFTGIDVWDDQNLSLTASGAHGSQPKIALRFNRSKNKPYAVALSFGQRPAISFGTNNVLNLKPDALFFLTAAGGLPYFTSGFAGTTNLITGAATACFTIPWSLPAGTCIYVGAAAVNTAFPNNLDVSNVECIKIR